MQNIFAIKFFHFNKKKMKRWKLILKSKNEFFNIFLLKVNPLDNYQNYFKTMVNHFLYLIKEKKIAFTSYFDLFILFQRFFRR